MLNNENIIIFSSDDWSSGLKTSKYHIAVRLAKRNNVLFVNSIGMRNPQASVKDLKRIWSKLKRFFGGLEKMNDNLSVLTPIVIPFHNVSFFHKINQWILAGSLKRAMRQMEINDPIAFVFTPIFVESLKPLKPKRVVYYCIDELAAYREVDHEKADVMERQLFKKADLVITCSQRLYDLKKSCHESVHYLPHGVDWDLFRRAVDEDLPVPEDMRDIPRPIIGYFGFLSDDWIDVKLLGSLAKAHTDWSIVLIGRSKGDFTEKCSQPNIHFLGLKPFESLPAYTKAFDVGIIPFARNDLTLSSNPLKLYEYLAGGLSVVSVDIPEVHRFSHLIEIAQTAEEFSNKIEKILSGVNVSARELSDAVKQESWDNRIEEISCLVNK
ncbi:MAG: glycosyltransferase [Candidatus Omnitrophica bacterium]|nr:glycosyltransferase [Candidatus Omnitrophota bacterium]